MRGFQCFVLILLSMALLAQPAAGQQGTGAITGRVTDNSGAVIPGVNISLSSSAVMGVREAITDERGAYRFEMLPLGAYTLKFELPGFATLIREGIQITAGFTATINASLQVATQSETITVTGASPVVDTQSSTVAVNLTPQMLANLPTARDYIAVAAMAPGVMVRKWDVGGSMVGTSTGLRNYGTDGQEYNLQDGVIVAAAVYGDFGSLDEVQVVTAAKSAEMKVAGVYTNKITKSGSNELHGRWETYWETPKLQSSNLTDSLKAAGLTETNRISRFYDVNADLGGPLQKDKFWWYISARRNWVGVFSPGYKKGGCAEVLGCRNSPIGTYVNDSPSNEDQTFWTDLPAGTIKLNYQLTPSHQLTFMQAWMDKHQPYRGGLGPSAGFFNTDSSIRQTYPNFIDKGQWTWILNSRVTFDTSVNAHDRRWPYYRRVFEYSRRDLDTQLVRGGFSGENTGFAQNSTGSGPNTQRNLNWQYNVFNLSVTSDNFITGTHNVRTGLSRNGYIMYQEEEGTVDQIILYYRNGFRTPAFIDTLDLPFRTERGMRSWVYYFNDTWKLSPKLTLGLGFRYDRTVSFYTDQEKKGAGRYQTRLVVPARDMPALKGLVPRLSLTYDIFGDGKTALKASYGRYMDDVGEQGSLAGMVNPMTRTQTRYVWDASGPAANCYLTRCNFDPAGKTLVSVAGGRDRDIDPNIKASFTDEYTLGVDRELVSNVSLRVVLVRKFQKNKGQNVNVAIPFSAYNIPLTGVDQGPDGRTGTSDDRTITLYSLQPQYVGSVREIYQNVPENSDSNSAIDIEVIKRFSNRWQLVTGWDYLNRKTWGGTVPTDPNNLLYNSGEYYQTWHAKVMGTYLAPYGVSISGVVRAADGEAYGRRWNSPRTNQGVLNLYVEPIGAYRMDTVKIVDFRAEKTFVFNERWAKLGFGLDIFNVFNSGAVIGINNLTGTSFRTPTQTLPPRVARLLVRYTF